MSSPSCFGDHGWSDDLSTSAGGPHWMVLGVGSFTSAPDDRAAPVQTPNFVATQSKKHWMVAPAQVISPPQVAQQIPEHRACLTSRAEPFVPRAHWIVPPRAEVSQQPSETDSTPRSSLIGHPVPEDEPIEHPLEPQDVDQVADGIQTPPLGGGFFGSFFSYVFGASPADDLIAAAEVQAESLVAVDPLELPVRSLQSLPAKALPVKHTFIHYLLEDLDDDEACEEYEDDVFSRRPGMVRSRSAPALLLSTEISSKRAVKEETHKNRSCKPCAYFHQKEDGCRWGDECDFCHTCAPGEIKKRKREKVKAMKAASKVLPNRLATSAIGEL